MKEKQQVIGTNQEGEIEIPDNTKIAYIVGLTTEGHLFFNAFGGNGTVEDTWLLAGMNSAATSVIQSYVDQQLETSNAFLLRTLLDNNKNLVGVLKSLMTPKKKPEAPKEKETTPEK
jgi:hypothetical protein